MKSSKITLFSLITALFFGLTGLILAEEQLEDLDGIAAIVNSEVITTGELDKRVDFLQSKLINSGTALPDKKALRNQMLELMIDQKVQLQTAKRVGIEISEAEIDDAAKTIAKNNNVSLDELKQRIIDDGMNYSDYREQLRQQITIDRLMQREIAGRISISKQEVDKHVNSIAFDQQHIAEYHVADILVALPEVPSSQQVTKANKKAEKILKRLNNNEDFAQVAMEMSNGAEALSGGDLGWRRSEEIPSVFAERIELMKAGEVSDPIRAGNGLHIIKLLDTRGSAARHYVQETKVRHILLKNNTLHGDEETKAMLEQVRKEIEDGGDFSTLARKYSEDPGTTDKGGELGWVTGALLVPPFVAAMNELPVGMISQPVKSEFGWHLIQVQDRREKDDTEEFQREQVRRKIFERQFQENAQNWVTRMRHVSFIDILIDQ